jgi:hypothetical protein
MRAIGLAASLALSLILAAAAFSASAQSPARTATVKPYKAITIALPPPVSDPGFDAMRRKIAVAAETKDRTALSRLVVEQGFFWDRENGNAADPHKSGLDNLAAAVGLNSKDGLGWDLLASFVDDPNASPSPDHKGALCSPADPIYDAKAFDALIDETGTDAADWGYPVSADIEVRAAGEPGAAVIDRLGLYLVRVLPDAITSAPTFIHIAMPSGKTGYVSIDAIAPMGNDQLCYVRQGGGWKIGGYIGGGEPQ